MQSNEFNNWKLEQPLSYEINNSWSWKYKNKVDNAKADRIKCLLTFEEYLFKAYEAGLTSPNQVGNKSEQYNLSRINDEGDYTVKSCRFITRLENCREQNKLGVNSTFYGKLPWQMPMSTKESVSVWKLFPIICELWLNNLRISRVTLEDHFKLEFRIPRQTLRKIQEKLKDEVARNRLIIACHYEDWDAILLKYEKE